MWQSLVIPLVGLAKAAMPTQARKPTTAATFTPEFSTSAYAWAAREPALSREQVALLLRWVKEGRLRPHIARSYPLSQASAALREVAERRVTGKVCLLPQSPES